MMAEATTVRLRRFGAAAAVAGGAATLAGYLVEPRAFFTAWLAAFYFWLSMPLGALALLLIWDLTGGAWEPFARVPLIAMTATMPLFVLLFLPIAAGMPELYAWIRPGATLRNGWYLNTDFFFLRAIVYGLIWNGFAAWRLMRPADADLLQWPSAIGLILLGLTVTFAGIDWIMSTEPDWFSSIYGMIVGSSQFIAALSCTLLLMVIAGTADTIRSDPFRGSLASLATILVIVVIFWAYTSFCQWLIIWEENLRTEIGWYIERWRGTWGSVLYTLAGAQFAVPFFALVWTGAKRNAAVVGAVCALLIVSDLVQVWWLLLPPFRETGFAWVHLATAIALGGIWLLSLSFTLRSPLLRPALRSSEQGG